jgi:hypothetical protein
MVDFGNFGQEQIASSGCRSKESTEAQPRTPYFIHRQNSYRAEGEN